MIIARPCQDAGRSPHRILWPLFARPGMCLPMILFAGIPCKGAAERQSAWGRAPHPLRPIELLTRHSLLAPLLQVHLASGAAPLPDVVLQLQPCVLRCVVHITVQIIPAAAMAPVLLAHPPLPFRLLRLPLLVLFLRPPLLHAPPSVHSLPLVAPVHILPSAGAEVVRHELRQAVPVGTALIIAGRRLVKSTAIQTIITQIRN